MHEPLLEVNDIQGNVLPGFGSPSQLLVGLRIGAPETARAVITDLLPVITSTQDVLAERSRRRALRIAGEIPPPPSARWLNIAFSSNGLRLLGRPEVESLDEAFRLGMASRSSSLGDPRQVTVNGKPNPDRGYKANWVVGGPQNEADILIIIATGNATELTEAETWLRNLIQNRLEVIYAESGQKLAGDKEHFGFRDDISHPGIRGLISENPPEFLSPRCLETQPSDGPEFSQPGQPLIWPGQFVLGYYRQSPIYPREPDLDPTQDPEELPPFARNGSFLVFRRLIQGVRGFYTATEAKARDLATQAGWEYMTGPLLRALMVGRWPSGLPLMRAPQHDKPVLEEDLFSLNHFSFRLPSAPVQSVRGKTAVGAPADRDGLVCPAFAHIRKVNPRDINTDQGPSIVTLRLRILRRGIPFGPPYDHAQPDNPNNCEPRGLFFLSYQASIKDQFEIGNNKWMNNPSAPEGNHGTDLLVGQINRPDGSRQRVAILTNVQKQTVSITTLSNWVIPTGGGYFFSPGRKALTQLAGA